MAAITVNSRQTTVQGNMRVKYFNVDIATTGDTLVTGLKAIKCVTVHEPTGDYIGFSQSAGTLTVASVGGALTGVQIAVHGK